MKNLFKILTLSAVLSITFSSCDLDRYPYDSIEQSQSFQTIKDAQAYGNGLYSGFRGKQYGLFMYSTDIQSDLLNATLDFGNRNGSIYRWTVFLADDYTIRDTWNPYYNGIANTNNLINNIDKIVTTTDADKASIGIIKGEAYFFRAYYYYSLVIRWAKDYEKSAAASDLGVPIVLDFDVTLKPERATVQAVYDQILSDISQAKTLLSSVAGAKAATKITKDVVSALEARVYLTMDNYTKAAEVTNQLISAGTYPLASTAADLKKEWVDDSGSETILQLFADKPTELPNTNAVYLGFNPTSKKYTPDFIPQKWVLDLFAETDLRKAVYFEKKPVYIQGKDYTDIICVNKFPGNPALFTTATTNYAHKPKVFRIAEMYLINAEASAQIPGSEAKALTSLNAMRTARGLTALVGLTGTALLDAVKEERTRELMFEGFRLDDLKRWKSGFARKTPQNMELIITGADYEQKTVTAGDDKFVWGIPTNDMTTNPSLKDQQNPGW